jgi:hypothetical protein
MDTIADPPLALATPSQRASALEAALIPWMNGFIWSRTSWLKTTSVQVRLQPLFWQIQRFLKVCNCDLPK